MSVPKPHLHNIVIASHPQVPEADQKAGEVASFLKAYGLDVITGKLYDEDLRRQVEAGEVDLLIALGGDGTMLRAGHIAAPSSVPILGINMGRFGFLTEVKQLEWADFLPRLLSGDYWLEKRMMLCAEQWRGEECKGSWEVLNEVVVARGQFVRPVHLTVNVDGRFLTTYVADAFMAATATGSTAYALAAGGPILPPELRNILLVPVAPHLSIDRAIVLAEGATVTIMVSTDHEAVLSLDGQPSIEVADGDQIEVYASDHSVLFVRFQDPGYFYRNLVPHMNRNPSTGNAR